MKLLNNKRNTLLGLMLATLFVISSVTNVQAAIPGTANPQTTITHLAAYEDTEFYDRSVPESITLLQSSTNISLIGYCTNEDETDDLTCHITDLNGNGYNVSYDFYADGIVKTCPAELPAGRYRVVITGDYDIEKDYACVVFTRVSLID